MKEFNLEEAKAGKPVCTRDGNPARIICYDCDNAFDKGKCIVALIKVPKGELLQPYYSDGTIFSGKACDDDLFMATEKKFAWVNLYQTRFGNLAIGKSYETEEEAKQNTGMADDNQYLKTIKIEWEE